MGKPMSLRLGLPRFRPQIWELTRPRKVYAVSHAGVARPISFAPPGGTKEASVLLPNVSLVVFDLMLFQILQELFLKSLSTMVLLLISDVSGNRISVGLADAERAIPGLPSKFGPHWPFFMNPF